MSDYTDKIDGLAGVPAVVADARRMQIDTGALAEPAGALMITGAMLQAAIELGPDGRESLKFLLDRQTGSRRRKLRAPRHTRLAPGKY